MLRSTSSTLRWKTAETRKRVICSWPTVCSLFQEFQRFWESWLLLSVGSLQDCLSASAAVSSWHPYSYVPCANKWQSVADSYQQSILSERNMTNSLTLAVSWKDCCSCFWNWISYTLQPTCMCAFSITYNKHSNVTWHYLIVYSVQYIGLSHIDTVLFEVQDPWTEKLCETLIHPLIRSSHRYIHSLLIFCPNCCLFSSSPSCTLYCGVRIPSHL